MTVTTRVLLGALLLGLLASPAAASPELFLAVRRGDCCTARFLIHLEPKIIEARSVRGARPLHIAALYCECQVVRILIDAGADVNSRCFDGTTPLMQAADVGALQVIQLLDVPGLDLTAFDKNGWTALHYAAQNGSREVVRYLLDAGCSVNARTLNGTTPLSLALVNNHLQAASLIAERGGIE